MPYLEETGIENVVFACPDVGGVKGQELMLSIFKKS